MKFLHYIRPGTTEEALAWAQKPGTVILGGMMWLHLQNRTAENAVDLSELGLDRIENTEDGISVGAYVTLRQAETDALLLDYTYGAIRTAFLPIVGVQFRNTATVGGSIFGRFGFSDVTTLFAALGASLRFAGRGVLSMEEFIRNGASHDILTHILLPKALPDSVVVMAQRKTATGFPVLTTAVCRRDGIVRAAVSPAPLRVQTMDFPLSELRGMPEKMTAELSFRSDGLSSALYREHLSWVLLKRAADAVGGQ